ncbi:Uncharacterized protein Fot_48775 [Forsythia ovata]|uniref:Uncharacterized protein n=1 Tax=Forsythia ovata TaxID=205694 RepID=A0ABD1QAZ1_9LAMI
MGTCFNSRCQSQNALDRPMSPPHHEIGREMYIEAVKNELAQSEHVYNKDVDEKENLEKIPKLYKSSNNMPNSAQQSQDHQNALDSARSHVQICSPTERYDQGKGIPNHSLHDDGRQNYASPQGSQQRSQHVDCSEQHATRSPRINGRVNRTILHFTCQGREILF